MTRAAVSIQRFYRDRKGYPNPPPSSPTPQYLDHMYQSLSSIRLDYETYLRLRRSRHKSTLSVKSLPYRLPPVESADDRLYNLSALNSPKPPSSIRRHISVNLEKLDAQTTDILKRASKKSGSFYQQSDDDYGRGFNSKDQIPDRINVSVESQIMSKIPTAVRFKEDGELETPTNLQEVAEGLGLGSLLQLQQNKHTIKSAPPTTLGKYYTQYAFLGKIESQAPATMASVKCAIGDNTDSAEFRLCIRKLDIVTRDPLEELIMRTVEGAEDIRTYTREIDRKVKSASLPSAEAKKIKHSAKKKPPSHLQRSFMRTCTNMNFSAFRAVEKAYQDRDQAEQLAQKSFLVKQVKNQEKMARNKVKRIKRNYKNDACIKKHSDRAYILEELQSRRKHLQDIHDTTTSKRETLTNSNERARQKYRFALDFRCQNAAVSKALLKHDHTKKQNELMESRTKQVSELRAVEYQKKTLAREYKEQTALIRQAETTANREELELTLLKNEAKRELDLRQDLKRHEEKQMRRLRSPTALACFTVI